MFYATPNHNSFSMEQKTLKRIAEAYAYKIGRPFDHVLQEVLKFEFINAYATLYRERVMKYGASDHLKQFVVRDLIRMNNDGSECVTPGAQCAFKVAKNVPTPMNLGSTNPFVYVGDLDKRTLPFSYLTDSAFYFRSNQRFNTFTTFTFSGGNVIVDGNCLQKTILIEGFFAAPTDVAGSCEEYLSCIPDTKPYPIDDDMIDKVFGYMIARKVGFVETSTETPVSIIENR